MWSNYAKKIIFFRLKMMLGCSVICAEVGSKNKNFRNRCAWKDYHFNFSVRMPCRLNFRPKLNSLCDMVPSWASVFEGCALNYWLPMLSFFSPDFPTTLATFSAEVFISAHTVPRGIKFSESTRKHSGLHILWSIFQFFRLQGFFQRKPPEKWKTYSAWSIIFWI